MSHLSKNAQKRALRKRQKKEQKEAELTTLLRQNRRDEDDDDDDNQIDPKKQQLEGGGKACRARRARNGETAVGSCVDHRPSGGAPVTILPQHEEIVSVIERHEQMARLKFRPDMKQRKVVPMDNHGSMEAPGTNNRASSVTTAGECSLTEHNLRSFSISLLPTVSLASLVSLDLSRNELWDLPDDLSALMNLEKLDLSRNWFRNLPKSISQLGRSLQSLHASHNMLRPTSLQIDILKEFSLLTFLDISCNQKCGRQSLKDLLNQQLPRVQLEITINFPPHPGSFVGGSAAERDASLLRSQLEPWSTTALRRRLVADFGDEVSPPIRAQVMERLLQKYGEEGTSPRLNVLVDGTLLDEERRQGLLTALRAWSGAAVGGNQERTSVNATNYMILVSPAEFDIGSQKAAKAAAKLRLHKTIWDL